MNYVNTCKIDNGIEKSAPPCNLNPKAMSLRSRFIKITSDILNLKKIKSMNIKIIELSCINNSL